MRENAKRQNNWISILQKYFKSSFYNLNYSYLEIHAMKFRISLYQKSVKIAYFSVVVILRGWSETGQCISQIMLFVLFTDKIASSRFSSLH